jgi:hypothetical protein
MGQVDAANRLLGLTFEVVAAWHPLAGAPVADAIHLDPGRLCVLMTRRRPAGIVVGRDSDLDLLEGVPQATPGYLGWDRTHSSETPAKVCSVWWSRTDPGIALVQVWTPRS